ncbi:hypothetical protein GGX14DRAFT_461922, partial [Mycena pura]
THLRREMLVFFARAYLFLLLICAGSIPSVVARAILRRATDCTSQCQAMQSDITNAGTSIASLCTQNVVNDYASCLNCKVSGGILDQLDAQAVMNSACLCPCPRRTSLRR